MKINGKLSFDGPGIKMPKIIRNFTICSRLFIITTRPIENLLPYYLWYGIRRDMPFFFFFIGKKEDNEGNVYKKTIQNAFQFLYNIRIAILGWWTNITFAYSPLARL